jgi:hypothetical protein
MTQQPTSHVVAQQLTMYCVDGRGVPRPLEASFSYAPIDPYAVWITFHSGAGDVRWAVCRTLIAKGLTEPVGDGDIQLWPSIDDEGRAIVVFEFCSPDGELVAHTHTADLHTFLFRTLAAVPFGTERTHLDMDTIISALIEPSAG